MNFTELFIYGTLKDPKVRNELIGRPLDYVVPDSATGFELSSIAIEGVQYPILARGSITSRVDGFTVIIHEDELRILDEYETDAYAREMIILDSGKRAWVYMEKKV